MPKKNTLAGHPIMVGIGVFASILTIFAFATGVTSIRELLLMETTVQDEQIPPAGGEMSGSQDSTEPPMGGEDLPPPTTTQDSAQTCVLTVHQPECSLNPIGISVAVNFFDRPIPRARVEFFSAASDIEPVILHAGGSGAVQVVTSDGRKRTLDLRSEKDSEQLTVTIRRSN